MNWIKQWVYVIAVMMVFISFIELLMPDKKYKKYIKFILGLIFIIVLVEPIVEVFAGEDFLSHSLFDKQIQMEKKSLQSQLTYYDGKQKSLIKKQYDELLKKQVENILSGHGYQVEKLELKVSEDSITELKGLKVWVRIKEEEPRSNSQIKKVKIDRVIISQEKQQPQTNKDLLIHKEVKKILGDYYHMDSENIEVVSQ